MIEGEQSESNLQEGAGGKLPLENMTRYNLARQAFAGTDTHRGNPEREGDKEGFKAIAAEVYRQKRNEHLGNDGAAEEAFIDWLGQQIVARWGEEGLRDLELQAREGAENAKSAYQDQQRGVPEWLM